MVAGNRREGIVRRVAVRRAAAVSVAADREARVAMGRVAAAAAVALVAVVSARVSRYKRDEITLSLLELYRIVNSLGHYLLIFVGSFKLLA